MNCENCISFEVCHAVKLAGKMANSDVLCKNFINKDLINRQKAEIERLQANYLSMQETLSKMSLGVEQAKTEAVKEFAKFLIDKSEGGMISISDSPDLMVEWQRNDCDIRNNIESCEDCGFCEIVGDST